MARAPPKIRRFWANHRRHPCARECLWGASPIPSHGTQPATILLPASYDDWAHVRFGSPIATIQRTSGEVRFVLFRKWDRHYSIASAARTVPPGSIDTPGLLTHP